MLKHIQLTRIPYEEPHHINLLFKASNGKNSGQLEIYDNAETLVYLADFLEGFPFQERKAWLWELGSENPVDNSAYYFKCSFEILPNSSDCFIHVRLNNNEEDYSKSISEFSITCEPGEINKLGKLLREFSKLEKESLFWSGIDGSVS